MSGRNTELGVEEEGGDGRGSRRRGEGRDVGSKEERKRIEGWAGVEIEMHSVVFNSHPWYPRVVGPRSSLHIKIQGCSSPLYENVINICRQAMPILLKYSVSRLYL